MSPDLELIGRRSSHYTRVVRILALELDLPLRLSPIMELMSRDAAVFAGNPALKLPILRVDGESVFGTGNICRVLARLAGAEHRVFWPEQADSPLLLNAHELLAHAMAAQVEVVMHEIVAKRPPDVVSLKRREGLVASLAWLDRHLDAILAALPDDRLRCFDITLHCLLEHIPFRNPIDLGGYPALTAFSQDFAQRASAQATPYGFDA